MENKPSMKTSSTTIAGAVCWGLIGLFIAPLYARGFTAWDVVAIRGIFSFVFLFAIMMLFFRDQLQTRIKDHLFFASAGIFSLALFNYFYFEVFSRSSLSLAVTLLYTGPIFVMILSRIFFKEPLTARKVLALASAIVGCALVVRLLPLGSESISSQTLFMGVLSGFCYALYSIFTKPITKRYSALTITTYTFFYMALFMSLTSDVWRKVNTFRYADVWIAALLLALISTVAAYVLYTSGLKHLEAGKASILATIEPIVAVVVGVLFLGDQLLPLQLFGIALVLYSAILIVGRKVKSGKSMRENHYF
ncbi:DMT family transporter [Sporosarcina sp. P1]|uniref:DMT family transporter n=1 Tax=Sporosarcina sp. P1 TaxID=2048257 RepID=UPI001E62DDB2|nr:DMT family transporter [Sporosarcina sp. P1]